MHAELDPATYGLTIWDLDREFLTGGVGRHQPHEARRPAPRAARRLLPHRSASSTCTSPSPSRRSGSRQHVEGVNDRIDADEQRHILGRLNAAEAFEKFLGHQVRRPEALRHRRRRVRHPDPRRRARCRRHRRPRRRRHGHGPPRPAQRADQHRRQELRPALQGVRGLHRPRVHPGLGRRQVPPRPDRHLHRPPRPHHPGRAGRQPEPPRDRRPGGRGHGPRQAGPDQRPRGVLGAARSSSTATPPSPARAWWPRRSTAPPSRATGSAAPST